MGKGNGRPSQTFPGQSLVQSTGTTLEGDKPSGQRRAEGPRDVIRRRSPAGPAPDGKDICPTCYSNRRVDGKRFPNCDAHRQ